MGSSLYPILFLLLILPPSTTTLHRAKLLTSGLRADPSSPPPPTSRSPDPSLFPRPNPTPPSSSNTTSDVPTTSPSSPPPTRPPPTAPSIAPLPPPTVVLEWSAACRGRQLDCIFDVWLDGVELLRSCSAKPRTTGILWIIKKDVTRYSSLFAQPRTLAVYLGNLVDQTYTGVYHVNISFHFFFDSSAHRHRPSTAASSIPSFTSLADLILPLSQNLPLNDGL